MKKTQGIPEESSGYIDLEDGDSRWYTTERTKNNQIISREEIAEGVWEKVNKILN